MGGKLVILVMSILIAELPGLGIREVKANMLINRKMLVRNTGHAHAHAHVHGVRFHAHAHANSNAQGDIGGVDSIKTVNGLCATTTYKDACIKSLSSLTRNSGNNNPQQYFKSGINMALDEITKASYLPNTLLPKANSKRATSALNTCKELLEQSIDRLKMASDQVGVGDLHSTLKDPTAILNLRLELGDVNTFSTNCLDEFVEAQDPQLQQLMQDGITNAKELAVNMLDVVSTYQF